MELCDGERGAERLLRGGAPLLVSVSVGAEEEREHEERLEEDGKSDSCIVDAGGTRAMLCKPAACGSSWGGALSWLIAVVAGAARAAADGWAAGDALICSCKACISKAAAPGLINPAATACGSVASACDAANAVSPPASPSPIKITPNLDMSSCSVEGVRGPLPSPGSLPLAPMAKGGGSSDCCTC